MQAIRQQRGEYAQSGFLPSGCHACERVCETISEREHSVSAGSFAGDYFRNRPAIRRFAFSLWNHSNSLKQNSLCRTAEKGQGSGQGIWRVRQATFADRRDFETAYRILHTRESGASSNPGARGKSCALTETPWVLDRPVEPGDDSAVGWRTCFTRSGGRPSMAINPARAPHCPARSLKVITAISPVVASGFHAAVFEICVRSRTGTGRCVRASRSAQRRRGRRVHRA
jgi:hypothetical protein